MRFDTLEFRITHQPLLHPLPLPLVSRLFRLAHPKLFASRYPCPAGFYGDSFDDMKTPKCSGLCPPGHVCSPGTVAPEQCESGGYCTAGSSVATRCPVGFFSEQKGLSSQDQCSACPLGHYCLQGSKIACGLNTFNPVEGSTSARECLLCPLNSRSGEGASHAANCSCEVGFVRVNSSCVLCPDGASCTSAGTAVDLLPLLTGYWRFSNSSLSIYRCPDASDENSGCIGGTGSLCKDTLEGVFCSV